MSNPMHWWYSDVKRAVMHSPRFRNKPQPEYRSYIDAIDKALEDVRNMKDAKERLYAIDQVLFKKTKTIDGVAEELHFCRRKIQVYISDYINAVGAYKGYEGQKE